ncbi:MAG: cytidylyltransferase domain-containing protein, partial [Ilumatobacteraceae bacterium]
MKILCTICARAGSKGVANKNLRPINSKPLIAYSIEQALATKLFGQIVVSSDSADIRNV